MLRGLRSGPGVPGRPNLAESKCQTIWTPPRRIESKMRGVYNWCKTGSYMALSFLSSFPWTIHYNDPLTGSVLSLPFPQTISLYFSLSPYLCILIAARSIFIQSPGLCRCSSPLLYHLLQCNHPGLYLAIASKYPPPLCRPVAAAAEAAPVLRWHARGHWELAGRRKGSPRMLYLGGRDWFTSSQVASNTLEDHFRP